MTSPVAGEGPAADAVERFFEGLADRDVGGLLHDVRGRIRFDVDGDGGAESWVLRADDGDLVVERGPGDADCTIAGDRTVFDELVAGRANPMAAVLRGALRCHGDLQLLFPIQRIFPDPPPGWDPTATTRGS